MTSFPVHRTGLSPGNRIFDIPYPRDIVEKQSHEYSENLHFNRSSRIQKRADSYQKQDGTPDRKRAERRAKKDFENQYDPVRTGPHVEYIALLAFFKARKAGDFGIPGAAKHGQGKDTGTIFGPPVERAWLTIGKF